MRLTTATATLGTGRVVRVIGPVVDVEFPRGAVPELFNALTRRGRHRPASTDC